MSSRFHSLQGKPLDAGALSAAIVATAEELRRPEGGFRIQLFRGSEPAGLTLRVDLLGEDRAKNEVRAPWSRPERDAPRDRPYSWNFHHHVRVGAKTLENSSGGGNLPEAGEFKALFEHASAAAPFESLDIQLQLIGDWVD